jgi:endo-1,4-beta-xylanase
VTTVVSRYKGRIGSWDVVNEAIADGPGDMRDSKWYQICGDDFIIEAFKAAHAADPKAKLFYNDYNIEAGAKREKALRLIKLLKEKHCPIDGVGIQGHWQLDQVPFGEIEKALKAFQSEGLSIAISELDLGVVPRKSAGAAVSERENAGDDPYAEGCPPDVLQRQAEQYAQIFSLLRRYDRSVDRVTLWGLHDGRSWLNGWPRKCTNHPLLWDRNLQPKPAFAAVMRVAAP